MKFADEMTLEELDAEVEKLGGPYRPWIPTAEERITAQGEAMAHINVRLTDEDRQTGGGDDVHPEGPLRVKVTSYEQKKKNDGSGQYLSWRLDPSGDAVTLKRPVWLNTSLRSGSLKGLIWFLDAIQIEYTKETEEGKVVGLDFDPDNCIGAEFIPTMGVREYNGKPQNDVKLPYAKVKR